MDYSLITEKNITDRYGALPENLKNAATSEHNLEIVRRICRNHFLNEEKSRIVEQLTGMVILGFAHLDELKDDLTEYLHLNAQHAQNIVEDLNDRIFYSIKDDVEKNYSGFVEANTQIERESRQEGEAVTEAVGAPKVSDILEPEIKIFRSKAAEVGLPAVASAEVGLPAVASAEVGEAEPVKIVSTEEGEKIILPKVVIKEPETAAPAAPPEAPVVLHQEAEGEKDIFGEKKSKSLGSFFAQLLGREPSAAPSEAGKGEAVSKASVIESAGGEIKLDGAIKEDAIEKRRDTIEMQVFKEHPQMDQPQMRVEQPQPPAAAAAAEESAAPPAGGAAPEIAPETAAAAASAALASESSEKIETPASLEAPSSAFAESADKPASRSFSNFLSKFVSFKKSGAEAATEAEPADKLAFVETTAGRPAPLETSAPAPLEAPVEILRTVHYEQELRTPIDESGKPAIDATPQSASTATLRDSAIVNDSAFPGATPQDSAIVRDSSAPVAEDEITEAEKAQAKKVNFKAEDSQKESLSGKIKKLFHI